jgi:hypothetical protein
MKIKYLENQPQTAATEASMTKNHNMLVRVCQKFSNMLLLFSKVKILVKKIQIKFN